MHVVGRLKKMKSMQPNDFEEEVARSIERAKNRRPRKALVLKWDVPETPYSLHAACAGLNKPPSPFSMELMSPSIMIPETPPSMRRKLQELWRKKNNQADDDTDDASTPLAPITDESDSLQRRLFEGNESLILSPDSPRVPSCAVAGPSTVFAAPQGSITTSSKEACSKSEITIITIPSKHNQKKHKLFRTSPEIAPPSVLLEPTKATNIVQGTQMLFNNPKKGRVQRKMETGNDSDDDGSGEKPKRKQPRPSRKTELELLSHYNGGMLSFYAPAETVHQGRVTRRQSIAVSTPTKASVGNATWAGGPRPGRKSLVGNLSDPAACGVNLTQETEVEESAAMIKLAGNVVVKKKTVRHRKSMKINPSNTMMGVREGEPSPTDRLLGSRDPEECSSDELRVTSGQSSSNSGLLLMQEARSTSFNATIDDSLILKPPQKRYLKTTSSARKKAKISEATRDGTSSEVKCSQTGGMQNPALASQIPCLSHSRRSLEEFHPSQFKATSRHRKLVELPTHAMDTSEDSGSATSPGVLRRVRKTYTAKSGCKSSSSDDAHTSSEYLKKHRKRPKVSLVTSSMHLEDKDIVQSIIKHLGGFHVVSDVTDSTTHVVCGGARRTLNVLYAIVRGAWLVSKDWVMESLEAGQWLDEEPFELHDYFPAAQKSRLQRVAAGEHYMADLLRDVGGIYVADQTTPPHHHLVALIKLSGGQVTQCARKATLCVGIRDHVVPDCVSEQWLLDSITSFRCMQYNKYAIQTNRRQREMSPDF